MVLKKIVKIGQTWLIKTVKNSKQRATTINTGEYGHKRSAMVKSSIKNSPKMSTIVKKRVNIGQKWSKMVKNGPKR